MNGRRRFIFALGGAAATLLSPRAASTQDRIRKVGILMGVAQFNREAQGWLATFKEALHKLHWHEGRNINFDVRWPAGDVALMKSQAADLVGRGVDVVLTHATPATAALRAEGPNVPNAFVTVHDPVGSGFVESIARPGGSSTGFANFEQSIGSKWLGLLKETAPKLTRILVLANPNTPLPAGLAAGIQWRCERAHRRSASTSSMLDSDPLKSSNPQSPDPALQG